MSVISEKYAVIDSDGCFLYFDMGAPSYDTVAKKSGLVPTIDKARKLIEKALEFPKNRLEYFKNQKSLPAEERCWDPSTIVQHWIPKYEEEIRNPPVLRIVKITIETV